MKWEQRHNWILKVNESTRLYIVVDIKWHKNVSNGNAQNDGNELKII